MFRALQKRSGVLLQQHGERPALTLHSWTNRTTNPGTGRWNTNEYQYSSGGAESIHRDHRPWESNGSKSYERRIRDWGSDAIGGAINIVTRSADPCAAILSPTFSQYYSTAEAPPTLERALEDGMVRPVSSVVSPISIQGCSIVAVDWDD